MNHLRKLPIIHWVLQHRQLLGIIVIVVTLALLGWYVSAHPDDIHRILSVPPLALVGLAVLYLGILMTNVIITYATVRLCHHEIAMKNSVFLTVYSTIINFFGPLQSGPGVRAVYLKTKVGVRIRDYTAAMFFYYVIFACINASLLFITAAPWLSLLGVLVSIALIMFGIKRFHFTDKANLVFLIYLMVIAQVLLTTTIYLIELTVTKTSVSFLQAIVYSSSANLSLFVSITPGAIGIREAFILFTQSLHHISLASVVAAGILDRAFYIIFLIILFVISSSLHVKDSLLAKKTI